MVPTLCQTPTSSLSGYCLLWKEFSHGPQIPERIKALQSKSPFSLQPRDSLSKMELRLGLAMG